MKVGQQFLQRFRAGESRECGENGLTQARKSVVLAGLALGVDEILYELTPSSKVQVIQAERSRGPVMMVGDGVNDAPALATADVGVAMGARGAAASSEAASVVILVDQLEPLGRALRIAKRTRRIALQSVFAGLGLSLGGMLLASLGWIAPVPGALLQEGIDVAVILNALRALRISPTQTRPPRPPSTADDPIPLQGRK